MPEKRIVHTDSIKQAVIDLIHQAGFSLAGPVKDSLDLMKNRETGELAKMTMEILSENARIAEAEEIPLCQDCGMTMVFLEIGQEISLTGGFIHDAVNEAVKEAYSKFYLRKSVVSDPLARKNTGTNTPAVIHTGIAPGDRVKLIVYLKGGGSENMTGLKMFRPTAGVEDIIGFVEERVISAGPNPCPPLFVGIGIGGTADIAILNSKKAVLRGFPSTHENPYYAGLEERILERLNKTGIGPLGFGGHSTAAAVFIREAPTHIASLPVALNLNCHSFRYREIIL